MHLLRHVSHAETYMHLSRFVPLAETCSDSSSRVGIRGAPDQSKVILVITCPCYRSRIARQKNDQNSRCLEMKIRTRSQVYYWWWCINLRKIIFFRAAALRFQDSLRLTLFSLYRWVADWLRQCQTVIKCRGVIWLTIWMYGFVRPLDQTPRAGKKVLVKWLQQSREQHTASCRIGMVSENREWNRTTKIQAL
jgi:hypothetical protein